MTSRLRPFPSSYSRTLQRVLLAVGAKNLAISLPIPVSRGLMIGRYLPLYLRDSGLRRQWRAEDAIVRSADRASDLPEIPLGFVSRGASERIIEIPWVLRRLPISPRARVLDAGSAFAPLSYRRVLRRLATRCDLHLVDLVPGDLPGATFHHGDLRDLPFASRSFDAAVCISTLEHVGMDNREYGLGDADTRDEDGDIAALRELGRVVRRNGRVLVTVPAGRPAEFNSFRQYSPETWAAAVSEAGLQMAEVSYYVHDSANGWVVAEPDALRQRTYRDFTPAAAALICAALLPA